MKSFCAISPPPPAPRRLHFHNEWEMRGQDRATVGLSESRKARPSHLRSHTSRRPLGRSLTP